jgi:hypothetical protein
VRQISRGRPIQLREGPYFLMGDKARVRSSGEADIIGKVIGAFHTGHREHQ